MHKLKLLVNSVDKNFYVNTRVKIRINPTIIIPETIIINLVLNFSDNFDHKYIVRKTIIGTLNPKRMYFGIIFI